jgi:DNA-binding transcriptional LysR family regulator
MELPRLDLNLLVVFDAMMTARSVTLAGEAIGLSQPAMSAAVARLRAAFDDPLFVRSGAQMKPTPRALELAGPIRGVLERVQREIVQRTRFAPETADRTFTIIMPDIGEHNFVPRLLARLRAEAPNARLKTITLPRAAAAEAIESGVAELAIGYFPDLQTAGFYQQKLFDNPHVCIVRSDHPAVGETLTSKAYLAASHAIVRPEGREHVYERFLEQRGLKLDVVLVLSHFMSLVEVIETSDLIATVPLDVARLCCSRGRIRQFDVPVESPVIPVYQFWHTLFHKDEANQWLRSILHSLFSTGPREAGR